MIGILGGFGAVGSEVARILHQWGKLRCAWEGVTCNLSPGHKAAMWM